MLKRIILHWILPKLLTKKSPQTIPRSGEEGEKVDCYTISLLDERGKPLYLVEGMDKEKGKLSVLRLENATFSIKETLSLNEVHPDRVGITHYFGLYNLYYNSVYVFALNFISKYDLAKVKVHIFWDIISQSRFNKRELVTKNSLDLLNFLVINQLNENISRPSSWGDSSAEGIDTFLLMTKLYSFRWISHPHSSQQMRKLELYLESLTESGDLKKENKRYFVTGKALKTLEGYEENERRHKDALGIQRKIVLLTLILAIAAVVEADLLGSITVLFNHIKSLLNY